MNDAEYSLQHKRVVITRAAAQAAEAGRALAARGGVPIYFPTIAIAPANDNGPLDDALRAARSFDWIAFPSTNAARAVGARLTAMGLTPTGPMIAAMGPATAGALGALGLAVTVLPEEAGAEALARALGEIRRRRVLLLQADIARPQLAEALTDAGAQVTAVTAYRTVTAILDTAALAELKRGVDAVSFASPSAVVGWAALTSGQAIAPGVVACIGPTTAEAVREAGLPPQVVAEGARTWDDLLDALAAYWEQPPA